MEATIPHSNQSRSDRVTGSGSGEHIDAQRETVASSRDVVSTLLDESLQGHGLDLLGGGPLSNGSTNRFAHECATETLMQLMESGRLSDESHSQCASRYANYLESRSEEKAIIDTLSYMVNPNPEVDLEEEQHVQLDQWSGALIDSLGDRRIVRLPFLGHARVPAIYREFSSVFHFCATMMTPIIQAHEKDLITVASINAVTSKKVAAVIAELIQEESGRTPITFVTVAPSKQWLELNRKHFGK